MTTPGGRIKSLPRRILYALLGVGLAAGAPLGLLGVRLAGRAEAGLAGIRRELAGDASTYLYVAGSTTLVFALFGYVLGRQADALLAMSRTDPLTALGNALAFQERFEQETARARRYGEPLSLMLLDVDRLKAINDRDGHLAGSRALQAVGRALRESGRAADFAARVGGDEFALLAPSTPAPAAVALAERIRILVAAAGVQGLTVSVGVATLQAPSWAVANALWDRADAALYEAKRRGRNCVVAAA